MAAARCGLTAAQVRGLKGKVKHFFHLAAIYDLDAKAEAQRVANVDGTQNALDLAAAIEAGCFPHASSLAPAGLYPGIFRRDRFAEAPGPGATYPPPKQEPQSRGAAGGERGRHAERAGPGGGDRGGLLPPRQFYRRGRAVPG